jgi:tight adherence protein B
MRRLLGAVAVGLVAVLGATPAYGVGSGQIDHLEVADDGRVQMLYSLPGSGGVTAPDLDSVRVTVAGEPVEATASAVEAGEVQRTAILALDVSASMRGARFAAAKDAALAFLAAAPDDVAIGLVTFAGSVTVVAPPTTDHDALVDQIADLQLSLGTLVYEGILESIAQLGSDGQRQVVVLSDGADTGDTPLTDVVSRAKTSGVTVDVVALEQSAANQAKLRQVTAATTGSVLPADDPAAVAALFARQAEALAQQVLIEFQSSHAGGATVAASLDAGGQTYTDSTFVSLQGSPAAAEQAARPLPATPGPGWVDHRVLFAGLGALGLGLLVLLSSLLTGKSRQEDSLVQRQLAFYSSTPERSRGAVGTGKTPKAQLNVRESAVAMAGTIVKNGDLETRITKRLTAAGISLTAAEWLLAHAGLVAVAGLLGLLLGGGNPMLVGICLLGGALCPWVFLGIKETRRLKAFNSQLADTLQLMSGGLSAGLSLPQAVDTVVREGAEPMAGELRRALVEQRLGVDIEDALDGVAERMQSKDFEWVVMAIRIQREIGGNLAELLDTVAGTIREREYLRRQVRTLSAEGRLSAWILGGLPPVFALYLMTTKPGYLEPMYTTSLGWMLSVGAVVMLAIGALWLKSVVKVEV